ncbi:MAG: hypothetical protein QM679_08805 [Patulibacter sp.]
MSTAPSPADADAALLRAAIACAERAQRVAEDGGHSSTAETWATAAAELALAAKGVAVPLPARPGK